MKPRKLSVEGWGRLQPARAPATAAAHARNSLGLAGALDFVDIIRRF
jgi:hypothetical protein